MTAKASKATKTRVDTILFTPEIIARWKAPPFQRPLRINDKVRALSETIKANGGVLPDILTIGLLGRDEYLIDGQHRCEAFSLSGLKEGYTEIRYETFESMADMGERFVLLNSRLVNLRPDDILRGLEGTSDALKLIRKRCQFVGYDQIRRGTHSPIVGMSQVLRSWVVSATETPAAGGGSATEIARNLTTAEASSCVDFLTLAEKAWGRDSEYQRLWSKLNITLCMWIYRRVVLSAPTSGTRAHSVSPDQFRGCLMSLSADSQYLDWLVGRNMGDRDRSPAYGRIKAIFQKRLYQDTNKRWNLPGPEWAANLKKGAA